MYKWINKSELFSSYFKQFNKKYGVLIEEEYEGIAWEYPWIMSAIDYTNVKSVLFVGCDRLYEILKFESKAYGITIDVRKTLDFYDLIIIEDFNSSYACYANLLNPLGKIIVTYRYSDDKNSKELEGLLKCNLLPLDYNECALLPFDPKFNDFLHGDNLIFFEKDGIKFSSLGLQLFKPLDLNSVFDFRFSVNPFCIKNDNLSIYSDGNSEVDTIGIEKGIKCEPYYIPNILLKRQFSINDICVLYNMDEESACFLINELINDRIIFCDVKEEMK